eukprot:CAMPEP_0119129356 /NCGR_PEP_ID=MMETSP1310-20130426/7139_1 /TAXON_ID=464262 /ORGANISM="Genus nov. species nov., Strain RCC2339" /LENGTH=428 /DNA_ID=CAMNT_0007119775 /DNA_START=97 /DNA_END=1383 /DNA_ORIENTATION=-
MKGSVVVVLVGLFVLGVCGTRSEKDEVFSYLRKSLPVRSKAELCVKHDCCHVESSTDGCSLTHMPHERSTLVFPGGASRCIFSYSTDYSFQVWAGATDKVLFYFQGGGACWDKQSTFTDLCTTDALPDNAEGVFNRSDEDNRNRFSSWTIINILYCSGDLHAGDVVRPYDDKDGIPVSQRGQANVLSVYEWVEDQQRTGALDQQLSEVVVMGCSAGSMATQFWSHEIITRFNPMQAAVVPDSFIGLFPPNTEGPLAYDFGMCNASFLNPELMAKCEAQTLTTIDLMTTWMQELGSVPFTFVQSKVDEVQIYYYKALAISVGQVPRMTPERFYNESIAIMDQYNVYNNFLVFSVTGPQHCFTPYRLYGEAGPKGATAGGEPLLEDWVSTLPLSSGHSISSVCDGPPEGTPGAETTYCSTTLVPKTYTEP